MKWGWVAIGTLALVAGVTIWRLRRAKPAVAAPPSAKAPSEKYDVQPMYRLPEGVTPLEIGIVDPEAVEAVKYVHGKFVLDEAYMGPDGLYLVQLPPQEDLDPAVFLVTPKE
ncbi:MAG: hypothetical protein ACYTBJ_00090 [Planctomycetota bacterium]|jgi:hypothetical protein